MSLRPGLLHNKLPLSQTDYHLKERLPVWANMSIDSEAWQVSSVTRRVYGEAWVLSKEPGLSYLSHMSVGAPRNMGALFI